METQRLQKLAIDLNKQEFRKAHPCLGFIADFGPDSIRELDFSKGPETGATLRKVHARGESATAAVLPGDYEATVEVNLALTGRWNWPRRYAGCWARPDPKGRGAVLFNVLRNTLEPAADRWIRCARPKEDAFFGLVQKR